MKSKKNGSGGGRRTHDLTGMNRTLSPAELRRHKMAPQVGFEPTTDRLTADCSTTELLWNMYIVAIKCMYELQRRYIIYHNNNNESIDFIINFKYIIIYFKW